MFTRRTLLQSVALGLSTPLLVVVGVRGQEVPRHPRPVELRLASSLLEDGGSRGQNFVFSPDNLASTLQLALLGARGETAEELRAILDGGTTILEACADGSPKGDRRDDSTAQVHHAHGVWLDRSVALDAGYRERVKTVADGFVGLVDFRDRPDTAADTINAWVARETRSKVEGLFSSRDFDSTTRMVLAGALYFRAPWSSPFAARCTEAGPFRLTDDREVEVPFMHGLKSFGYAEDPRGQYLQMPYGEGRYVMVVALPSGEGPPFDALDSLLGLATQAPSGMVFETELVDVRLPKFRVRNRTDLTPSLMALGLRSAFDPAWADFDGISPSDRLAIAAVVQEATIQVDETGTEASAATGIGLRPTSTEWSYSPKTFHADRPFLFAIADRETRHVLFLGKVIDPSR